MYGNSGKGADHAHKKGEERVGYRVGVLAC